MCDAIPHHWYPKHKTSIHFEPFSSQIQQIFENFCKIILCFLRIMHRKEFLGHWKAPDASNAFSWLSDSIRSCNLKKHFKEIQKNLFALHLRSVTIASKLKPGRQTGLEASLTSTSTYCDNRPYCFKFPLMLSDGCRFF